MSSTAPQLIALARMIGIAIIKPTGTGPYLMPTQTDQLQRQSGGGSGGGSGSGA